ncbi:MAG TPA: response regulator [Euzebyales bacterium]|nr:response regulator [Euzebyales bacterium]
MLIDHRATDGKRFATHPVTAGAARVLLTPLGGPQRAEDAAAYRATVTKPVKQSSLLDVLVTLLTEDDTAGRTMSPDAPSAPSLDPGFARRHPLHILVAEDNPTKQRLMTRLLQRLGYAPTVVGDGAAAVEAAGRLDVDVVLMDIQMPYLDGYQATQRIRTLDGPQPWIVAVTANATDADREWCRQAGMDDHLAKPVRPELLTAALRRAHDQPGRGVTARQHGPRPATASPSGRSDRAERAGDGHAGLVTDADDAAVLTGEDGPAPDASGDEAIVQIDVDAFAPTGRADRGPRLRRLAARPLPRRAHGPARTHPRRRAA